MPFQQVTLGDLLSELRGRIGLSIHHTDDELTQHINEAISVWQICTGYWREEARVGILPNKRWYTSTLLKPLRISLGGQQLDKANLLSMDFGGIDGNWSQSAPGTPVKWVPVSLNMFGIHPCASQSLAGESFTVYGLSQPPNVWNRADYIDAGGWTLDALLQYAHHVSMFKLGGVEFASTLPRLKGFYEMAGRQNEKFVFSSIYRKHFGENLEGGQHPVHHRDSKRTAQ